MSERYKAELARFSKDTTESAEDWSTDLTTERGDDYGHPRVNFQRIAGLWTALLGNQLTKNITPEDVGLMMVLLKASREKNKHKDDNLDDIDGYTACLRALVE